MNIRNFACFKVDGLRLGSDEGKGLRMHWGHCGQNVTLISWL